MKRSLLILFFLIAPTTVAAQAFNAGFVQGLWYSDEAVFVDQPVRIYVAIRNNTEAELTGMVEFFVDDKRIARNPVSALDGRIIESWADWTPSFGEHRVSAEISRIELHAVGSSTKEVTVRAALAEDVVFVDYDTDGDGVGDRTDEDDDGDGTPDQLEIERGTDPLDATDPPPEPVLSEADEHNATSSTGDTATPSPRQSTRDNPAGLEQYLSQNRISNLFDTLTQTINGSRQRLDSYRATRAARQTPLPEPLASSSLSSIPTSTAALSSPTSGSTSLQSVGTETAVTRTKEDTEAAGLWPRLVGLTKLIFNTIYNGALAALSLYLRHPVIVQLTFLFLILYLTIKVARRLGRRSG